MGRMVKKCVLVLMFSSTIAGAVEQKMLVVTCEGNPYGDYDVSDWEPGEEFISIGHYLYPWKGEDTIDWKETNHILWVNEIPVGASTLAYLDSFQDKSTFVTAIGTADADLLKELPKLKCYTVLFTYDYPLSMPYYMQSEGLLEWFNNRLLINLRRFDNLEALSLGAFFTVTGSIARHLGKMVNLKYLNLRSCGISDSELSYLSALKNLRVLNLGVNSISDDGLACLAELTELRELNLFYNWDITDDGIAHLSGLTKLKVLDLGKTGTTENCLPYLRDCKNLEWLYIGSVAVTDKGLVQLMGFEKLKNIQLFKISERNLHLLSRFSELRELYPFYVDHRMIRDDDLLHISGLAKMEHLSLAHTEITNEGLKNLSGMVIMRDLNLTSTGITDEGLVCLDRMEALEKLKLQNTEVTDQSLKYVSGLKNLRELNLIGTEVTEQGLYQLDKLTRLQRLYVDQDLLTEDTRLWFSENLPECKVCHTRGAVQM